jgi:hypothetical protein
MMNERLAPGQWTGKLQEFTHRNTGRLTVIEEDDPEFGAQEEERGIQLRGVAYDPRDGSVAIMLGDLAGTNHHLTHVVRDVSVIDVLRSATGRDVGLRLGRGEGQTLIHFCSS